MIYVDGACRNNGQDNPQGGCGIYWGEYHPLNTLEYLTGEKQTNNRAELSAAIIALTQAHQIKMQSVEICTDSKYVKEGITKWINKWKSNKWKTARDKADVLNKDLWTTLDSCTSKLQVKWQWIEGHGNCDGNNEADALAKSGISHESCYWQTIALGLANSGCEITSIPLNPGITSKVPVPSRVLPSSPIKPRKAEEILTSNCGVCDKAVSETGIQCVDCRLWYHFSCSQLPAYQLYIFEVSQRRYSCEKCSMMDDDFQKKFNSETSKSSTSNNTDADPEIQFKVIHTNAGSQCVLEDDNPPRPMVCITARSRRDFAIQAKPQQVDREVQATDGFGTFAEHFAEFKEGIISQQEKSFVNALDNFSKFHSNISDLQAQIKKLTQEKEDLIRQKQQSKVTTPQKTQQVCRCKELQSKIEVNSRDMESMKQKCFKINLDKEIETSKLEGANAILNQKLESASTQMNILNEDIRTMEKRLTNRNETIIEIEDRIKAQNSEILRLQDEIMSWKLHASRGDDALLLPEDKVTDGRTHSKEDKTKEKKNDSTNQNKEKSSNTQKKENTDNSTEKRKEKTGDTIDLTDEAEKATKVLLIGTSNLKFINTQQLSDHTKVNVEKVTKYRLDECQNYIDSLTKKDNRIDGMVLHLFENDIAEYTPEQCIDKLSKITDDIRQKFTDAKVIISMGLPQGDEGINRKISKLNFLLKEKWDGVNNVSLCDNGNLFYRGNPSRGMLNADGKHLSRQGTRTLGANLKQAICKTLRITQGYYQGSYQRSYQGPYQQRQYRTYGQGYWNNRGGRPRNPNYNRRPYY